MSIIMLNDTQRAKQCLLPLDIAAYRACIDQRGAVGAIAEINGLNANTLALKINPNRDGHHLNPSDLEAILAYTKDPRIMDAVCAAHGNAAWFALPPVDRSQTPQSLLSYFADVADSFGALGRRLFDATADNVIDADEFAALQKAAANMQTAIARIVHAAAGDVQ